MVAIAALLGGVSGAIATTIIVFGPEWEIQLLSWLTLALLIVIPGLIFGLIIGFALSRPGLAGPSAYAAYIVMLFNRGHGVL